MAMHTPVSTPRISVVIPTFQRREIVMATVRSLARQDITEPFEVIVVVDGSTDGTAQTLRALDAPHPLIVLEQPNQGASTARNSGAACARGDIILFIDDDMEAHPHLLIEHERSHREGAEVVLGHFPLHPLSPQNLLSSLVQQWVDERALYLTKVPGLELTVEHLYDLHAAQLSVRREVFHAIGGFSGTFTSGGAFGNEDYDFGYRLALAGCRIVFNPHAITWQRYVVGPRYYLERARQAGRADVAFARKYPRQQDVLFQMRSIRRCIRPTVWRIAVATPWLAAPVTSVLRALAVVIFRWGDGYGRMSRYVRAFFFRVETIEYWNGVREAQGVPERSSSCSDPTSSAT
jgi:glycosyltransferase involved in cell wall biosynthesis